jgi:hypothetical protein
MILGLLSAASIGETVQASAVQQATTHSKKVFVVDILTFFLLFVKFFLLMIISFSFSFREIL